MAMLGAPAPALAVAPLEIGALIGEQFDACGASIFGAAPTTGYTVTIERGDPSTVVKTVTGTSTDAGAILAYWPCKQARLLPGDRVHAIVGAADQTWTVPALPLQADPVADLLSGSVPPASFLTILTYSHCFSGVNWCDFGVGNQRPTVGLDGSWSYPTGSFDLQGGDAVTVEAHLSGETWSRILYLPTLSARPGSALVTGQAVAGKRVRVTLLGKNGVVRATALTSATALGRWKATLKHQGKPVQIRPGDRVRANLFTGSTLTVSEPGLVVKASTGKGSARCLPGAPWAAIGYKNGKDLDSVGGNADATTGRIAIDFSADKPVTGWTFTLRCLDANGLQLMDAAKAK
ncbi:MAG: hypothetical protein U0869_07935 [Chloroflexota bacterium]